MKISKRIYEDFFKEDRLPKYGEVLTIAKENGYRMVGILDFYNLVASGQMGGEKLLVNRHDIDTSPRVARQFFEIEKRIYGHEGSATYYFRNNTIDIILISEIEAFGYETGYHYEEIATYVKKHKIKNKAALEKELPQIREEFNEGIKKFRQMTSSKSLSVASHGDFINVIFNYHNSEILKDHNIRNKCKIVVEAYDDIINSQVNERFADQILLGQFSSNVLAAIERNVKVIQILTHPRNWKVHLVANSKANIIRFMEEVNYDLFIR